MPRKTFCGISKTLYWVVDKMREVKKVKFTGFPRYHDPRKQSYYDMLSSRYDLVECEDPDYVLDGGQSFEHEKYDAVKILICSENDVPDFNTYDYAIASSELDFGDRYLRVPWYVFSPSYNAMIERTLAKEGELLGRKFCSFVVSNAEFADPMRQKFLERLSAYKRVDSGGKFMNNVGGVVKDKQAFCRGYKFNIAFENSSQQGYVTEKIVDAYAAQTVPIYYGSPTIGRDFNVQSMVWVRDESDIERAVEEVVALDKDDAAYLKRLSAPVFPLSMSGPSYLTRLQEFLYSIFDSPLSEVRRLSAYGHQAMMHRHLRPLRLMDYRLRRAKAFRFLASAVGAVRRIGR